MPTLLLLQFYEILKWKIKPITVVFGIYHYILTNTIPWDMKQEFVYFLTFFETLFTPRVYPSPCKPKEFI